MSGNPVSKPSQEFRLEVLIKLPQLRILDKDQYEHEDFEEAKDIKEERRVQAEVEAAAKAASEAAAQLKEEEAEQNSTVIRVCSIPNF